MPLRITTPPRAPAPLPRALLFDMDDTLFDHTGTCRAALDVLRSERPFLRATSLDALAEEYGRLLESTHTDVMLGRRTAADVRRERFRRLAAVVGRTIDEAEAEALSQTYRAHYQRLRRPVPGAGAFLRRVTGDSLVAVITNNTVEEQREKLRFLGLEPAVDLLVTSEEIGAAKPRPEIFRAALERAGVPAEDAVMIGDSWETDVRGALGAGIRPVWFNRFDRTPPASPAVDEFSSFEDGASLERLLRGRPPVGPRGLPTSR